ncbi:formate dehydrogenase major subunit [Desulfacinum infernum DSM 9756]|uniref:nitrate reductase (cytochrome) n=2 Tax=Desulfacinum infernum TaxID=35837 RepID=A0A1M5EFR3_9BACT|nr:formate dehydrogenase major subunit [Desulfacinum infernum DSM 9756]
MTNSIAEIEETDVILITGSNTSEAHPIIGRMIKRAVDRRRAKLIVVDPRKIPMVSFANIWLRPRPGTDVAWINGLCHVILEEGLWDREFVAQRTEGFEEFRESVKEFTPEYVEQVCGIPAEDLRRAARLYARAPKAMIFYAMGITQHAHGTDNVKALANLVMLCGQVGREGTGLNPLRGQNNVQGACDMGALPNVLPGYQPVTDEEVLARFQAEWATGVRLSNKVGMPVTEMFPAVLEGRLRAMYIVGENPALSDANVSHVREALEALDFLVVQDIFFTETAAYADVVLPAASFAEKDGTFTNTERRVQRVRKAIDPPGRARADWEIFCRLAKAYSRELNKRSAVAAVANGLAARCKDRGYWDYADPSEIFDELAAVTPIYAGLSYKRVERGGIQWPCPSRHHPGTPYLHKDRFARGRGKFHALAFQGPAELPDEEYPFYLSTGRIRFHYHTGTMTRRCRGLDRLAPAERIQIHPQDAERLGIRTGDRVRVVSRRGEVEAEVLVSENPAPGMVFATFHFAEVPVNVLTNDALDPVSKIPELKVCAVRVEKVAA